MKLEFYNNFFDFNDEVDLYFLHETVLYNTYQLAKQNKSKNNKVDRYTSIFNREVLSIFTERAWHAGCNDFAMKNVHTYDSERFENLSADKSMIWKKSYKNHDTLIIHLNAFGGHEGRLASSVTNINEKIINLETDLLIVNEDPFRVPETIYPAFMILGCSDNNNTLEKMCNQIRSYIKKEYKNIILYADSRHASSVVSIAIELYDLKPRVLTTGGQTTVDWDRSPWVKNYFKWFNRPKVLRDQHLSITPVAIMHMVKCWKFKNMGLDSILLDPYRYIDDYDIRVDFIYGKYDRDYLGFKNYLSKLNKKNVYMKEIDYKISETQTHNIRPYVDRKILPEYIKNL
jgi:hypothetical protein